jgi:hypothetical protein
MHEHAGFRLPSSPMCACWRTHRIALAGARDDDTDAAKSANLIFIRMNAFSLTHF